MHSLSLKHWPEWGWKTHLTACLEQPGALEDSRWHWRWSWLRWGLRGLWAGCWARGTSCFPAAELQPEGLCHPSFSAPGGAGSLEKKQKMLNLSLYYWLLSEIQQLMDGQTTVHRKRIKRQACWNRVQSPSNKQKFLSLISEPLHCFFYNINRKINGLLSTHQEPRPPGSVWCQSRVKSVEPERRDESVRQIQDYQYHPLIVISVTQLEGHYQ